MNARLVCAFVVFLSLVSPVLSNATELRAGLDVSGQWKRGDNTARDARLRVIAVEGNVAKVAYAAPRSGPITEDSFWQGDGDISEPSPGIKVLKFHSRGFLSEMSFTFDPNLPYVKGTWTGTRNETYRIEMK